MEYDFAFNISPLEFRVLAIAKPTASIGLEISGSVMISEDYELWSQRLATIRIPAPVPVPFPPYVVIVPIPVSPTLKIIIEGDAEASAALGVGAEIYVSATAGVHYKDGKLNPAFEADLDPMYRVSSGVDFDLSWNVEVRARGELHFSLLGVAGPYAGVVPYYGITSGCGNSLAETYMGWRLEVGGDLTAIGGPRLELPVYDSSPMAQERIPLSRMPSGDNRCQEELGPDPDPGEPLEGLGCTKGAPSDFYSDYSELTVKTDQGGSPYYCEGPVHHYSTTSPWCEPKEWEFDYTSYWSSYSCPDPDIAGHPCPPPVGEPWCGSVQ